VTNAYLFKLGFHSDHHIAAARPYPLLRRRDEDDVLPAGYSGMILLSLVPPLWRSVMDWRVDRRLSAGARTAAVASGGRLA
jgi:alkane 1-monooxygenase